ncbi:SUMF1/EgtB/PvdO family nonheme iron enzyme [Tamlana sp. 2_MG-2023]|uniref:formylglycine-generating enzyme family protein n=1 Tax=unclassified Tamlana TaxID=2614803 RepID=UPI0026E2F1D8|nr:MULTISPECIES: SUMF1/EgtB/PvdO family nonheme iron enzyme [unclassified Tamlana]MDO6761238.1 SUMF1/EgtB/PvdO family nonheme iron enzyme [Tamlana sp. 2_MG-2023]MDO6791721.1 SUMF1/EgtB/PvdO family nonheme iron enzyme [Tamlana sp. 1_MG-2023]
MVYKSGGQFNQGAVPHDNMAMKHEKPQHEVIIDRFYMAIYLAYEDAEAYCKWAGRRLPPEAEWEYVARANNTDKIFFLGDEKEKMSKRANSWVGEFPVNNTPKDGFENATPVKSYLPNDSGLFDMPVNVWEYTSDRDNVNCYSIIQGNKLLSNNPNGSGKLFNTNKSIFTRKRNKRRLFIVQ